MGGIVGVPTPTIRALHLAAKLLDRSMRADAVAIRAVPLLPD